MAVLAGVAAGSLRQGFDFGGGASTNFFGGSSFFFISCIFLTYVGQSGLLAAYLLHVHKCSS